MPINSFLYPGAKFTPPYQVGNSLRFNQASSDHLTITPGSAGNRRTFTISFWFKRSTLGTANRCPFSVGNSGSSTSDADWFTLMFHGSTNTLRLIQYNNTLFATNQVFRDSSAWAHIVIAVDTTDGTAGDRIKLYINGSQVTSFSSSSNPSQNYDFPVNNTVEHMIGREDGNANVYFDGYLAEYCIIDGSALAPTSFGEFDSDSPTIWKPKDVSGLTFGTNGFYLEFKQSGTSQNSSGLGADTSGQDNHFAVNNLTAVDQSTDTRTNNFATLNPLDPSPNAITFSEGNLKATGTSGNSGRSTFGSFALSKGKWWCEIKVTVGTTYPLIGIIDSSSSRKRATYFADSDSGTNQSGFGVLANDDIYHNGSIVDTWVTFSTDDIIGLGLDMDASPPTLTFKKNNGDEKTINTEVPNSGFYNFPAIGLYYSAAIVEVNFGNPSYSISSGNADANGYGNFEHPPKSGYYSCCTKNLAEFG